MSVLIKIVENGRGSVQKSSALSPAAGDATSTVLLDGTAGGTWDFEEQKKTLVVKVALFEQAGQAGLDALRDEVIRLAVALKGGPQNLFKPPLKDATGEPVFAT